MTEGHGNLNGVEAGTVLWEARDLAQVHEQFSTSDESHDEENLLLSLEDIAHANKEGMIRLQEDVFLQSRRFKLIVLHDNIFS